MRRQKWTSRFRVSKAGETQDGEVVSEVGLASGRDGKGNIYPLYWKRTAPA
jgi:hypothetical protein